MLLKIQFVLAVVAIIGAWSTGGCFAVSDCYLHDDALVAAKQQFNISVLWVWTDREPDEDLVAAKNIVEERLNKVLPSDAIKVGPTIVNRTATTDQGTDLIATTTTITTESTEPIGSSILSRDLLSTLKRLVDCSSGDCSMSNSSLEYSLSPSNQFERLEISDHSRLLAIGRFKITLQIPKKQSKDVESFASCQNLCDQILAADANEFSLIALYSKTHTILMVIVSMLEPQNWLILILSIWLAVCLVIAMLIKSQDRRKLRLHLQERAEYSFSKPRDRP